MLIKREVPLPLLAKTRGGKRLHSCIETRRSQRTLYGSLVSKAWMRSYVLAQGCLCARGTIHINSSILLHSILCQNDASVDFGMCSSLRLSSSTRWTRCSACVVPVSTRLAGASRPSSSYSWTEWAPSEG